MSATSTRPRVPQLSSLVSATSGGAARTLSIDPAHQEGKRSPERAPLSVAAPGRPRRFPFVLLCLCLLLSAMVGVLVLNVLISSNQYTLASLVNKKTEVEKTNADLTQQQQLLRSPQTLANRSRELGMVKSPATGQIDLANGNIIGNPKSAENQGALSSLVPQAQILGTQIPGQPNPLPQDNRGEPHGSTIPAPKQRLARP